MTNKTLLVLGATSEMALAAAHRFAGGGYDIMLAGRDPDRLKEEKSNLELRYQVAVSTHAFDVLQTDTFGDFCDSLARLPDVVVCAIGFMGEQAENEESIERSSYVMRTNYEGPALLFGHLGNLFRDRGYGTLVGISSVAGNRGRASNYIYGSAKAGFTAYLSGLRNRLASDGVHVVTVLPGFVRTRLLAGMDTPDVLTAEPAEVGEAIFKAVRRGQDVVYVRPVWWLVMTVIRLIPEKIFKKMSI